MGYVNKIQIGNSAHLIEPTLYAETGGTAAAITAAITGFEAIEGVVISLKITTSNNASATLNVNSGGEKAIYYNAAAIAAGILQEGHVYNFIYLNNSWHLLGDLSVDAKIEIVDMMEGT